MTTVASVGRDVLFFSTAVANRDPKVPGYGFNGAGSGPYAAKCTQVSGERISLMVFPPFDAPYTEGSVRYKRDGGEADGRWWQWPVDI